MLADLESLVLHPDPKELTAETMTVTALLLASGLDPEQCTIFRQSDVPEHLRLSWLLACEASADELLDADLYRLYQERAASRGEAVGGGILIYPIVQAADILLYRADEVPAGEEERQAIELAVTLAKRFNDRYGEIFVTPRLVKPRFSVQVRDLLEPERPMTKYATDGAVFMLDAPETIALKLEAAEAALGGAGERNLREILAALADHPPGSSDRRSDGGSADELRREVADRLVEVFAPIQERFDDLFGDERQVREILSKGSERAGAVARETIERAQEAVGLA